MVRFSPQFQSHHTLNDDHNILFSGTSYVKVPRGLMNLTTHLNDTALESFLHIHPMALANMIYIDTATGFGFQFESETQVCLGGFLIPLHRQIDKCTFAVPIPICTQGTDDNLTPPTHGSLPPWLVTALLWSGPLWH